MIFLMTFSTVNLTSYFITNDDELSVYTANCVNCIVYIVRIMDVKY